MLKRISCLGYFGYRNTGDEAILSVLVDQMDKIGLRDKLVVFSGDVESTKRFHAVDAVQNILPTSTSKFTVGILGRNRSNFVKSLRTYLKSDMLIIGGGGLFFDYPHTNEYVQQLLDKIRWGKRLGKKVVLLGVGVGPIHRHDTATALRSTLDKADLICVRDNKSQQLLLETGLSESAIHVTEDFAFLLKPVSEERIEYILRKEELSKSYNTPLIGIGLCGRHAQDDWFRAAMVKFCDHVIQTLGARICFIPMQTGGGFDDRLDVRLIHEAINRKEMVTLVEHEYGPKEILSIISKMDFVIGERFHAALFAATSGVPVIGISYMPKVKRLFHKIGQDDWCLDRDGLTGPKLIKVLDSLWETGSKVSADLRRLVPPLVDQSHLNFELFQQYLEKSQLL